MVWGRPSRGASESSEGSCKLPVERRTLGYQYLPPVPATASGLATGGGWRRRRESASASGETVQSEPAPGCVGDRNRPYSAGAPLGSWSDPERFSIASRAPRLRPSYRPASAGDLTFRTQVHASASGSWILRGLPVRFQVLGIQSDGATGGTASRWKCNTGSGVCSAVTAKCRLG